MGVVAAVIGGQYAAGERQAAAIGGAAEAQERTAREERAQEIALRRETRERAVEAATPSAQEIANLDRANAALETDLRRKEELIASADPALMEAGRQALKLLKGEEAATLDPVRRQRQKQREQLEDTLRSRLGSGYETSTAGQQALNEFDAGTGALLAGAQQESLNALLGVTQNVRNTSSITGTAESLAGLRGGVANRMISAINQTPLVPNASAAQYAGGQFQGEFARAGNLSNLFSNLYGAGTLAATVAAGGPRSGTLLGGGLPLSPKQAGMAPDPFTVA